MVKFVDKELASIRDEIIDMWNLVLNQLSRASQAVAEMDESIAQKITAQEKLVNSYDLKIDSKVEDFIALYNPVAVDLRFVLAMLNVNNNLERIGDYADGIARFVIRCKDSKIDKQLFDALRLEEMFDHAIFMVETAKRALAEENISLAKSIFNEDNLLDEINADSVKILSEYAMQHPENTRICLELNGVFRKLERTGDHINNIMEDIVFYIDANVMKHEGKHSNE